MNIAPLSLQNLHSISNVDENGRTITITELSGVCAKGRNLFYPNVLLDWVENNKLISPYDEKIMSLNKDSFYPNNFYDVGDNIESILREDATPLFFFVYNFDNYYHFIYDTLPYLFSFLWIKRNICSRVKLLVNTPNPFQPTFYNFNKEFLNKFVDFDTDCIMIAPNVLYRRIWISSSLTHGGKSNLPPRKEVYDLLSSIKVNILKSYPKAFYISRRTWIHNDTSNLGTNYTTRRKMMNEDLLVQRLGELGICEIFTEQWKTDEKIHLFQNAELVIGSIGGGMSNLLFSPPKTHSIVIATPFFLDINYRFKYSMEHTRITYFNDTEIYNENGNDAHPLFCRVQIPGEDNNEPIIGEIVSYNPQSKYYTIQLSNNDVAGFNSTINFSQKQYLETEFILLDKGLNSMYSIDIDSLMDCVNATIKNMSK
jgi:hypothetical protein